VKLPRRSLLVTTGLATLVSFAGAWTPARARAAAPFPATAPRLAVARLQYDGDDWYATPSSLPNLITAIRDRT